ncbi:hypothetical protein OHR68_26390 [Spirillospora sp. NBC_00431]
MSNEHAASETLRSVIGAATAIVDGVEDGQLTAATPCDVRALLNHMVVTARMFAIAAEKVLGKVLARTITTR